MVDYVRKITHQNYGKGQKDLNKYFHKVHKEITQELRKRRDEDGNHNFMYLPTGSKILPYFAGSVCLLLTIIFLIPSDEKWSFMPILLFSIGIIGTVFFIIYLFTMPKKEYILNRKDGLITFPGFYWKPNITIRFDDIIFCYSTGGEDVMSSFQLQIIRPTKDHTFFYAAVGYGDCYKDISFITWYMDKNRPLPPGNLFNEFRQQDYERRKAEGFNRPLYFSKIETPEATLEQQKERKKIGGW